MVYLEKQGLPPAAVNRLLRLAAFENPQFHRAQAMRMTVTRVPRVIGCGEEFPQHIGLPRGCLDDVQAWLQLNGAQLALTDDRFVGEPMNLRFYGQLQPEQVRATAAMIGHDFGILEAPPAFGKTVVAARLIADRNVSTLVLVHRKVLLEQWSEQLTKLLGVSPGMIGGAVSSRAKPTGVVDIAAIQSLYRKIRSGAGIPAEYGHVVVDECHHVAAFSFETVLRSIRPRYVAGLTATATRSDGHHPIIEMQCGPIRYGAGRSGRVNPQPFRRLVVPRPTQYRMDGRGEASTIQDTYTRLSQDRPRNRLIIADVSAALKEGRTPLVITERRQHLEELAAALREVTDNVVVLCGGMGAKKCRAAHRVLAEVTEDEPIVVVATGKYAGEGFDHARLDTLFLTLPVSWRGLLEQYAGRLHRMHAGKSEVRIYDYVDYQVASLLRMYRKRLTGYRRMGYELVEYTSSGALASDSDPL